MDLKKLDTTAPANDGVWMDIEHPVTGEILDIKIKVAGVDSDVYRQKLREQQNKRLKKGLRSLTIEELENESIELLVACTLDWKGVEYNGTELECNPDNIRQVYKEFPWLREQVDTFIHNRANFLKN